MKSRLAWFLMIPFFAFAQAFTTPTKLVFCSEGNPESLTPFSASVTSVVVYIAMNDTLVSYVRGETKITPSLAEHWQVSRDGKEYTFYLQQGVQWHNNAFFKPTRDLNADDVIFTIDRQRLPPDDAGHVEPFHRADREESDYDTATRNKRSTLLPCKAVKLKSIKYEGKMDTKSITPQRVKA